MLGKLFGRGAWFDLSIGLYAHPNQPTTFTVLRRYVSALAPVKARRNAFYAGHPIAP